MITNGNEEWCCRLLYKMREIERRNFWRRRRRGSGSWRTTKMMEEERARNDMQARAMYELLVVSFFYTLAKSFM